MAKDYSEDQLIQRSAAELMEKELGWTSVYALRRCSARMVRWGAHPIMRCC